MPRLLPSLLRQARLREPHAARLLPVCRDLASARNEVRWLKEHAKQEAFKRCEGTPERKLLSDLISRRASGQPLQYIIGSEYFGDLEIKCRPGVLIPRPETAASVSHLASLLRYDKLPRILRVLDLCTGTGCIALLFHHDFYEQTTPAHTIVEIIGIDASSKALRLANDNLQAQLVQRSSGHAQNAGLHSLEGMQFLRADVLTKDSSLTETLCRSSLAWTECDILISNPPYISSKSFRATSARSVRCFEPKFALVPPVSPLTTSDFDGDVFYPRLLEIADKMRAKVFLAEVADLEQATRVASMILETKAWQHVEIWRDWPREGPEEVVTAAGSELALRGTGHGRSVFAFRNEAFDWLHSISP